MRAIFVTGLSIVVFAVLSLLFPGLLLLLFSTP